MKKSLDELKKLIGPRTLQCEKCGKHVIGDPDINSHIMFHSIQEKAEKAQADYLKAHPPKANDELERLLESDL